MGKIVSNTQFQILQKPLVNDWNQLEPNTSTNNALLNDGLDVSTSENIKTKSVGIEKCVLAGLEVAMRALRELVLLPLQSPELYRHLGVESSRGIAHI